MRVAVLANPNRREIGLVTAALFIFCCGYNLVRYDFSNTAYFGGDTWYYQSIAVNLVSGDGYRFGALQDFEKYKYQSNVNEEERDKYQWRKDLFLSSNEANFYGSPGFPLFMAGIYRVVGIQPIVVKQLNVIFIAMAACLLPLISARIWSRYGFATGVLTGLYFALALAPNPGELLGEPLMMFLLTMWGLIFTYGENHFSIARVVGLAFWTAVMILVKSYVLLVFMTAIFLFLRHKSRRVGLIQALLFISTVACLILPWSVYATRHSDRVVVISTQIDNLVMDGNNEDTLSSGGWRPHWRKAKPPEMKYLYNRLADTDMSTGAKVRQFYRENWTKLPQMFAQKIDSAIGRKVYVILTLLVFIVYHVVGFRRNRRLRKAGEKADMHLPVFPIFCFAIWISNALIAFGILRYTLIFLPFMLITAAYAPLEFRRIRREQALASDKHP